VFKAITNIGYYNWHKNFKAISSILALLIKGVVSPDDEIKGSSPSPGAPHEDISTCFKPQRLKKEITEQGLGKGSRVYK
jgi:hypothetical protein